MNETTAVPTDNNRNPSCIVALAAVALSTTYVPMFMKGYSGAGVCAFVVTLLVYLGFAALGFASFKTMIGAFVFNGVVAAIIYAIVL